MQEYQDFNINDYVKVKLTDRGKYLYQHRFDDINSKIRRNGGEPIVPVELEYDNDGYVEFQLWHLMEIFGKYLFNGCVAPFETTIKFRVSSIK